MNKKAMLRYCLRFLGLSLLNLIPYPTAILLFLHYNYPILFSSRSELKGVQNLVQEASAMRFNKDSSSPAAENQNGTTEAIYTISYFDKVTIHPIGTGDFKKTYTISTESSVDSIHSKTSTGEAKNFKDYELFQVHAKQNIQALIEAVEKSIRIVPTVFTVFLLILSLSCACALLPICCRITRSPHQGLLKGLLVTLFVLLSLEVFLLMLMVLVKPWFLRSCDLYLGRIFGDTVLNEATLTSCTSEVTRLVRQVRLTLVTQQEGVEYFRKTIIFTLCAFVPIQTALFCVVMVILNYISSKSMKGMIKEVNSSLLELSGRDMGEYPMLTYYWSKTGDGNTSALLTVDV